MMWYPATVGALTRSHNVQWFNGGLENTGSLDRTTGNFLETIFQCCTRRKRRPSFHSTRVQECIGERVVVLTEHAPFLNLISTARNPW